MRLIQIEANENGGRDNQKIPDGLDEIPEGFAVIPEDMDIPDTFPFVNIVVDEETKTVTEMTAGVRPPIDVSILIPQKEAEISNVAHVAIVTGCDVTLSDGSVEHFSLEEADQINLNAALTAVQGGATSYPYHADKLLFKMYSAEDILRISEATAAFKLYHRIYCNHLLAWIRRTETPEELNNIEYGAELPDDLAASMSEILTGAADLQI